MRRESEVKSSVWVLGHRFAKFMTKNCTPSLVLLLLVKFSLSLSDDLLKILPGGKERKFLSSARHFCLKFSYYSSRYYDIPHPVFYYPDITLLLMFNGYKTRPTRKH